MVEVAANAAPQNDVEQVVVSFIDSFGPCTFAEMLEGYDTWLTDDVLWENTGSPACKGLAAAKDFMVRLHETLGMEYCTATIHNMASRGNIVLTERTDRVHFADGTVAIAIPIMGTFEVRDGKIARYSDYSADGPVKARFPGHADLKR